MTDSQIFMQAIDKECAGTPEYRLEGILAELDKRFPGINTCNSGMVPELYYLKHIDLLLKCAGIIENIVTNRFIAEVSVEVQDAALLTLIELKQLREKMS
jgi:hypothetical protein